jgi:hypothetical protein
MPLEPLPPTNTLRELEVSVTHRCTLACDECGFLVPRQPVPQHGDVADAVIADLEKLLSVGVRVERLVLVGGEPTLAPAVLQKVCAFVRSHEEIGEVEVVSNGLSPDRVDAELLRLFDRFVISDYLEGDELVELWRAWAAEVAPEVVVEARRAESWDRWTGDESVGEEEALQMWRSCWYRKHCVTLERGRLFSCSRIPKLGSDEEGLALTDATTLDDVREWLNADRALPSCATCVPMMDFESVPVARQPDDRLERLAPRALDILSQRMGS